MKEIILIRHGETEYNKSGRFSGSTDVALSLKGIEQATRLTSLLTGEAIDSLYSSDLQRCVETGRGIECGDIIFTDSLREMDFGHWEGLTYKEIGERYPEEMAIWEKDWSGYRIPEGESFADMAARVLDKFERIIKQEKESVPEGTLQAGTSPEGPSGKIVIVSHGGCIRAILGHYIIGSINASWRFFIDNASVTRLCVTDNGFFYLKSLNER